MQSVHETALERSPGASAERSGRRAADAVVARTLASHQTLLERRGANHKGAYVPNLRRPARNSSDLSGPALGTDLPPGGQERAY